MNCDIMLLRDRVLITPYQMNWSVTDLYKLRIRLKRPIQLDQWRRLVQYPNTVDFVFEVVPK